MKDPKARTHARIWDKFTSEPMKSRIMNVSDFETKMRDEPIESLTCVREVSLMPKKSRCHHDSLTEAMLSYLLCKQEKHESLRDHCAKWKQARDNLKEHVGDEWIKHHAKQTKLCKEESSEAEKEDLERMGSSIGALAC